MLTIKEYSFLTPKDLGGKKQFLAVCKVAGLKQNQSGYGLLHCVDDEGKRVTVVTFDVQYLRKLVSMPNWLRKESLGGNYAGIDMSKFNMRRDGWPDEWAK